MADTTVNVNRYYRLALWLGYFTILYNLLEGLVSVFFGAKGEALTLFGFGIDSFIEVLSGMGIVAMVLRIQRNPDAPRTPRITRLPGRHCAFLPPRASQCKKHLPRHAPPTSASCDGRSGCSWPRPTRSPQTHHIRGGIARENVWF